MNQNIITIVNEDDEIIWEKDRSDVTQDDIYRVSALEVRNSKGDFLLAQRGFLKRKWPWKRSVAVAGTVDAWETYDDNIYKEAEEEIWLIDTVFKKEDKIRKHTPNSNYFCQYYSAILDKPSEEFVLEEWQVENIRRFSVEEIKHLLKNSPGIFGYTSVTRMSEKLLS